MKNTTLLSVLAAGGALLAGCQTEATRTLTPPAPGDADIKLISNPPENTAHQPLTIRPASGTLGSIERLDPLIDQLLGPDAVIEKLAEGFDWSEGPVWMNGYLLFSDVPMTVVYRWEPIFGISEAVKPSGYTGRIPRAGEPGSNGLTRDRDGHLILCQHGDRRVARLGRDGRFETIAEFYKQRRFNSPNDLVIKSNGDIYFTDPPYGLVGNVNDPTKELPYQGVFRVDSDGEVTLLTTEMSRPNGIAFSPDEWTLYVANSDPQRALWKAFDVRPDGSIDRGRVLLDVTEMAKTRKGLPDGMKVDAHGYLWATGPGGVLIISPEGKHLGTLSTGEATANCAWGDDGSVLYITADTYLCRVKTKTRGTRFR